MPELYFIRHAESEMNKTANIIGGRSNSTTLSQKGIFQARCLGQRLREAGLKFDKIYSSTAIRTIETAKNVGLEMDFSPEELIQTEALLELDQGDWEGKLRSEIYTPEMLAIINSDNWYFTPPNGESQKAVEERMLHCVAEMLGSAADKDNIAIFTHGVAIKCLLRGIMDFSSALTYKIAIDNSAITRLRYDKKGWHLLSLNDTAHLLGKAKKF